MVVLSHSQGPLLIIHPNSHALSLSPDSSFWEAWPLWPGGLSLCFITAQTSWGTQKKA